MVGLPNYTLRNPSGIAMADIFVLLHCAKMPRNDLQIASDSRVGSVDGCGTQSPACAFTSTGTLRRTAVRTSVMTRTIGIAVTNHAPSA